MATAADMLRLPPELMLRISTYLNTVELGSFRLTCKDVERNLFKSFALEFFTKRQFMIERVSLDALAGIANHPTLAPYLNGNITPDYTPETFRLTTCRGNHWPRHSTRSRVDV